MEGQWFVIQVMSGQEKKVKKNLEENRVATGMTEMVLEVIVPTENVAEVKRGEQKISEKRLWPGYALVKMKLTDDSWMYVKETNGVIDFLGGGKPVPLSEGEVGEILHDLQTRKGEVAYKNKISVGDNVKITDGVFVNFMGTVEEVNHEKGKLSVMVSIFGRDTRVDDLEFWQVEEAPVDAEVE
ncbi:MAG: transcription termination/antitermination protein NusG [Simkaniaceae bacterium]|jgi:transcriptional antiterminator NusG|nr:MAG: transcription termination/antitermination protein NusG [Simkaniaceae bacterium]